MKRLWAIKMESQRQFGTGMENEIEKTEESMSSDKLQPKSGQVKGGAKKSSEGAFVMREKVTAPMNEGSIGDLPQNQKRPQKKEDIQRLDWNTILKAETTHILGWPK